MSRTEYRGRARPLDCDEPDAAGRESRARERWYRDLLQALPAAIYTTDAEGTVTFYNEAAAELAGRVPELGKDKWCVSWKLYRPDGTPLPHDECPMAIALKENREVRGVEAIVERPDGMRIPMAPFPTPLRDDAGRLIGAVNMLVDLSERKKAELLQHSLVNELNHRVKNTLATVQALAAHSIRAGNPNMRTEFDNRLIALSRAHDQLTAEHWASADLENILADTLDPFSDGRDLRVGLDGASVKLPPKTALLLAMIFHELATNAANFGALSGRKGRVDVSWLVEEGNVLRVAWRESGGPQVAEPERTGFGMRLLSRGVAEELGGSAEIRFDAAGVNCRIEVPLVDELVP